MNVDINLINKQIKVKYTLIKELEAKKDNQPLLTVQHPVSGHLIWPNSLESDKV